MKASYDSLDSYVRNSPPWAIETPCPQYEKIGVKVGDRYEQLNANVLQIENEYYSTVRPKQITERLERPTLALRRRGVRHVELRSPDINIFEPVGISAEQIRFLETRRLFPPDPGQPPHRCGGAARDRRESGSDRPSRTRAWARANPSSRGGSLARLGERDPR